VRKPPTKLPFDVPHRLVLICPHLSEGYDK
jgi:hypothetical protein